MKISKNFTLEEFQRSGYAARNGIDNSIPENLVSNIQALVEQVVQPFRSDIVKGPVRVSSGYRSPAVNKGIGGSLRSQHMSAEAADLIPERMAVSDAFDALTVSELPYDQLILEFGSWIHVSHRKSGPNRRQVLVAKKLDGKTVYRAYKPKKNKSDAKKANNEGA